MVKQSPKIKTPYRVAELDWQNWQKLLEECGDGPVVMNSEGRHWFMELKTSSGAYLFTLEVLQNMTVHGRKIIIDDLASDEEIALAELDREFPGIVEEI